MSALDVPRQTILDAITAHVFPAASVDVGSSAGPLWQEALGTLTFDESAAATALDTLFDLASLTKVIATTTVAMRLCAEGRLALTEPVSSFFPEWLGRDREDVTVRELLEHTSGLPARLIDPSPEVRREFEHEICTMRLEYPPRTRSRYSDLDFILLGFLAADRGGMPLAQQVDAILRRLNGDAAPSAQTVRVPSNPYERETGRSSDVGFDLPVDSLRRAAPTTPLEEDARRGRTLVGEVHDNYAAALGGVAGHAGLFGTAAAVGRFARVMLRAARGDASGGPPFSPGLVREFVTRSAVPGSSRALGWDTMLPTSSCGTRMSPDAFGHVGFTGTSLWIDPSRDRYFVLLANRAYGHGPLDAMRAVRRRFHDSLVVL